MSENVAPLLARLVESVTALRVVADRIERVQSDPAEINQALNDIAAGYSLIVQLAEVAGVQRTQLLELTTALTNRVPGDELRGALHDLLFTTKQLASISQAWRDDILLMRQDIRRLATACEAVLTRLESDRAA